MTQNEMAVLMQKVFVEEIMTVREDGQREYAGIGNDAFANFNRIAADLKLDRKLVLWVYAMKHRDGIASFLRGHTSQREDVLGRLKDLITYLFLLWGMIEEEREPEVDEDFVDEDFMGTGLSKEEVRGIHEWCDANQEWSGGFCSECKLRDHCASTWGALLGEVEGR